MRNFIAAPAAYTDNCYQGTPRASKAAREPASAVAGEQLELPAEPPCGIEIDNNARILDEIETNLRVMSAGDRDGEEPARLSDVSRLAAEQLAQQQAARHKDKQPRFVEPCAAIAPRRDMPAPAQLAADMAKVRAAFRDPRTPPWLLARSLETQPDSDWPPRRKRSRWHAIVLRVGLGATLAAIAAAVAIKNIPAVVMDLVGEPAAQLSTNPAAVSNEGKAASLPVRK